MFISPFHTLSLGIFLPIPNPILSKSPFFLTFLKGLFFPIVSSSVSIHGTTTERHPTKPLHISFSLEDIELCPVHPTFGANECIHLHPSFKSFLRFLFQSLPP